ncbi:MAG: OmpH family outer membrane protein [Bacteroidia bacterium]
MKKVIIALALIVAGFTVNAQTKVGHINTSELIELMPQTDSIQKQLQGIQAQWEQILAEKQLEMQTKYEAYTKLTETEGVSPQIIELKASELEKLQASYQETQQQANNDLQVKQQEYLQPLLDSVREAIEAVAKELKYDYVIDSTEGSALLYSNPSSDLMDAVKAKLGL